MSSILMVAPFFHVPALDGASQRATHLAEALAGRFNLHLLTYRKQDARSVQAWAENRGIRLDWLPDTSIKPVEKNAWQRMASLVPPGFASHHAQAIHSSIDRLMKVSGQYDCLFLATQLMGQVLLKGHWDIPAVVDFYDVYTPMVQKLVKEVNFFRPYHWVYRLDACRTRSYEREIVQLCNLTFTVSEEDQAAIQRISPGDKTVVIPNGVDIPLLDQSITRDGSVLLVANYSYAPNAQGFRWFYQNVWPVVKKRYPKARLLLAGKDNQSIQPLTISDGSVEWLGFVPDLGRLYQQASCALVPIFHGGGTHLKTLEAMAWQTPLVATSKGAMGIQHQGTITIADNAGEFAHAVINCLSEPGIYQEQAAQSRKIVEQVYSWQKIGNQACLEISKLVFGEPA